jgi:hypothetical protein
MIGYLKGEEVEALPIARKGQHKFLKLADCYYVKLDDPLIVIMSMALILTAIIARICLDRTKCSDLLLEYSYIPLSCILIFQVQGTRVKGDLFFPLTLPPSMRSRTAYLIMNLSSTWFCAKPQYAGYFLG